jgi:hypothetical protein
LVNSDKTWDGISYLGVDDLITDGKYHLYKINDVAPIKRDYYETMYMFNDESLQIPSFASRLTYYKDRAIDMYVSMKITGDITLADAYNLPVFYIDRIIVTDGAKELFPGTGVEGHPILETPSRPRCYKVKYADGDEWINPSMTLGYEFKTTERYNDKAVYKKIVDDAVYYRVEGETEWKPYAQLTGALPLSGGTMTGPLKLAYENLTGFRALNGVKMGGLICDGEGKAQITLTHYLTDVSSKWSMIVGTIAGGGYSALYFVAGEHAGVIDGIYRICGYEDHGMHFNIPSWNVLELMTSPWSHVWYMLNGIAADLS